MASAYRHQAWQCGVWNTIIILAGMYVWQYIAENGSAILLI
jgi:hypothetical protein